MVASLGTPRFGRVAAYDRRRGLGTVITPEGDRFDFHATAIADGSRAIAPESDVVFVLAAGHRGRLEARAITPVPPTTTN